MQNKVVDGHIHYAKSLQAERLNQIIDEYELGAVALQCLPKPGRRMSEALSDAFEFKKQAKIPVFIFGGIDREIYQSADAEMAQRLAEEPQRLIALGCNAVKMLEGKPDFRKHTPIPDFDKAVWEGYWQVMEDQQIALMWHVNDPESFWDAQSVSEYARKSGWFYDNTYVNNEDQYRQVLQVLARHPKLRITFPHFFFLSNQLERLQTILDACPNVNIDLTPGIEMYFNLGAQPAAREFFIQNQTRISYGSDIGSRQIVPEAEMPLNLEESRARIKLISDFLERDEEYLLKDDGYYVTGEHMVRGLGLEQHVLDKIYRENFLRFIS